MSHLQLRTHSYNRSDYAVENVLNKAVDPRYNITLDQMMHYESLWNPQYKRHHLLVERDGTTVAVAGYAEWPWWYEAGRYVFGIGVHPTYRKQGIGGQLYDNLLEKLAQAEPKGRLLMVKCWEDAADSIHFLTQRGFQQTGGDRSSLLNVTSFDSARFADVVEHVRQQGIEIISYGEMVKRIPDYRQRCYEMHWDSFQDVPATGTRTQPSFEHYVKQTFENPDFVPETYFVALDDDQLVGESNLIPNHDNSEQMITEYTGVVRSHRRRGIASALKVRVIESAKARGIKTIVAGNDSRNPMYELNLQLGFQPQPGELFFEKQLD